jgi:hypothetical protein
LDGNALNIGYFNRRIERQLWSRLMPSWWERVRGAA